MFLVRAQRASFAAVEASHAKKKLVPVWWDSLERYNILYTRFDTAVREVALLKQTLRNMPLVWEIVLYVHYMEPLQLEVPEIDERAKQIIDWCINRGSSL